METKTFSIPNISCSHCVMNIQKELGEIEGISKVEGDPTTRKITVGGYASHPGKDQGQAEGDQLSGR